MKWIGQHIYDNISRFRDDVYIENLSTTTESDVLVVDSTGKISKNTIEDLHHDTSSQASVDNSGSTYIQDITLDTYGHVTALTSAAIPTLNQDTSGEAGTVATIAGLAPNTATTQATQAAITTCTNLTTVGTIATGVWNATKILSPKTTHVIHYPFRGYAAGLSSGNFQFSEDFQDPQAPFQMNSDYGATAIASGNLPDVSDWFRSSITVMPRAVTATRMYGWVTCGGTSNITIALCKITPTRNDNSAIVPIVVATTVIAAIDNDKMDFFDVTASDAGAGTGSIVTSAIAQGDILMPFIIVPNTKTAFFNLTLEVEG